MRALVIALLALAPLAGCLQAEPTTPAGLVDGLADLAPFTSVVSVIDPEGGHGEPSFGMMPDGTLFANGDGGRGGGVYKSVDNGTTWERVATPVEPMPNFDPDLAVAKDGTVWFSALWIGCTATAASADGGESWTSNPAACNTVAADRQYVVPTKGGEAYLYSHQLPTFYQMAAKTTDYGRTWIPTGPVELPDHHLLVAGGGSGWGGGGFWNEATGSVFFTWTWSQAGTVDALQDQGSWAPGFAVTRDGGASWTLGTAESLGGRQLGLGLVVGAADEAGNVYLAWGEADDEGVGIYLAVSQDDGATWSKPIRVDDSPASDVFPAITAGAPGKVAIAYYQATEAAFPSDVSRDGSWNVTLAWTDDALAAVPTFQRANLTDTPVKTGPICISGTTCQGDREFADYFQVHVLPDGRVGAIFNSLTAKEGRVVEMYAATAAPLLR